MEGASSVEQRNTDVITTHEVVRRRAPRKCSVRQQPGHNKTRCPTVVEPVVPVLLVVNDGDFENDEDMDPDAEEECQINGEDGSDSDDDIVVGDGLVSSSVCILLNPPKSLPAYFTVCVFLCPPTSLLASFSVCLLRCPPTSLLAYFSAGPLLCLSTSLLACFSVRLCTANWFQCSCSVQDTFQVDERAARLSTEVCFGGSRQRPVWSRTRSC